MAAIEKRIVPNGWRSGQFLFNFLEWLRTDKGYDGEVIPTHPHLSTRMADPFHIPNNDLAQAIYREIAPVIREVVAQERQAGRDEAVDYIVKNTSMYTTSDEKLRRESQLAANLHNAHVVPVFVLKSARTPKKGEDVG